MSHKLTSSMGILEISKLDMEVFMTRGSISFRIHHTFSLFKNSRIGLYGSLVTSSLPTTIKSTIFLFIVPLEEFFSLGRPPVMDVMYWRSLFRSSSSTMLLSFSHGSNHNLNSFLRMISPVVGRIYSLINLLASPPLSLMVLATLPITIIGVLSKSLLFNHRFYRTLQMDAFICVVVVTFLETSIFRLVCPKWLFYYVEIHDHIFLKVDVYILFPYFPFKVFKMVKLYQGPQSPFSLLWMLSLLGANRIDSFMFPCLFSFFIWDLFFVINIGLRPIK